MNLIRPYFNIGKGVVQGSLAVVNIIQDRKDLAALFSLSLC